MTLPIQKATIAAAPVTVGGLPAVECPGIPPIEQAFSWAARWARSGYELIPGFVVPFDALVATTFQRWAGSEETGAGEPDFTLIEISLPITAPIVGAPTEAQVPGSGWFEPVPPGPQPGPPLLLIPTPIPEQFRPAGYSDGDDLWLRFRAFWGSPDPAAADQVIDVWVYFPEGAGPQAFGQEVRIWLGAQGSAFEELVIPTADPAPGGAGPEETSGVFGGLTGAIPEPRKAVAVAPGCATVPFPVEGISGGTPLPVVQSPIAPASDQASILTGWAEEPGQLVIPAGLSSVVISRRDDLDSPETNYARIGGYNLLGSSSAGSRLELTAPPGGLLPEILVDLAGGAIVDWLGVTAVQPAS